MRARRRRCTYGQSLCPLLSRGHIPVRQVDRAVVLLWAVSLEYLSQANCLIRKATFLGGRVLSGKRELTNRVPVSRQAVGMTSQQSLGMASAPSLGGAGEGGSFGNAMAMNAGPPMGSVGSTQDLQDLYRRYSSMPMQPSPARMLSMHDSAGSISLDEVGRSAARVKVQGSGAVSCPSVTGPAAQAWKRVLPRFQVPSLLACSWAHPLTASTNLPFACAAQAVPRARAGRDADRGCCAAAADGAAAAVLRGHEHRRRVGAQHQRWRRARRARVAAEAAAAAQGP